MNLNTRICLKAAAVVIVCSIVIASLAHAQGPAFSLYGGANGIWWDGALSAPNDLELGANASAALSRHIALVGGVYVGTQHEYTRGSAGGRFTVTNPDDQRVSVGLGSQYNFSSDTNDRPEGISADASLGYSPWANLPRIVLVAQGSYMPKSDTAWAIAGLRFLIGGTH